LRKERDRKTKEIPMANLDYGAITRHAMQFFAPRTKREREQQRDEWITYAMNVWGLTRDQARDAALAMLNMLNDSVIELAAQQETTIKLTQPVMPGFE
jgi:hypothetical protein